MAKVLNDDAITAYRDSGAHSPIRVFSPGEAATLRARIEAEEQERGPIFTENRPRPGDPFQGSYRFKSHLFSNPWPTPSATRGFWIWSRT